MYEFFDLILSSNLVILMYTIWSLCSSNFLGALDSGPLNCIVSINIHHRLHSCWILQVENIRYALLTVSCCFYFYSIIFVYIFFGWILFIYCCTFKSINSSHNKVSFAFNPIQEYSYLFVAGLLSVWVCVCVCVYFVELNTSRSYFTSSIFLYRVLLSTFL